MATSPVIGHFVHQALAHRLCGPVIDTELSSGREEVGLLDFIWPYPRGDTDHPQELVDIVSTVLNQ